MLNRVGKEKQKICYFNSVLSQIEYSKLVNDNLLLMLDAWLSFFLNFSIRYLNFNSNIEYIIHRYTFLYWNNFLKILKIQSNICFHISPIHLRAILRWSIVFTYGTCSRLKFYLIFFSLLWIHMHTHSSYLLSNIYKRIFETYCLRKAI